MRVAVWFGLCATVSIFSSGSAHAANLCDILNKIQSGETWQSAIVELDAYVGKTHAQCGSAMGIGGKISRHCYWAFDYRAQGAMAFYRQLQTELSQCAGAAQVADEGVNHPDSYSLENFELKTHQVALSYKDKATLSQSLVFVHLRPKL